MRPPLFLAIACGTAAACTEPPIEMRLALPDPATVSEFDLSCVYAVKTRVIGNDRGDGRGTEVHEDCVDFDTAPQTFSELAARLRDQFRFDVPRGGLAGVQVSGFFGRCSDPTGTFESIVYGGAPNEGGGTLTVPLKPGVSCNMTQGYNVRVFDLAALYATLPGGGTCAAPPDPVKIFAGLIRPSMLGDHAPPTAFEYGHSSVDTSDGMARIHIEVEIANFYPAIASKVGRWFYIVTQSRIHVLVCYGFLRSLARLDLAESKVGRFATLDDVPDPQAPPPSARPTARTGSPGGELQPDRSAA